MNWLAHILISENDIDYQLGNVLADPLKGRSWDGASAKVKEGLKMHCNIDTFTDSHSLVVKSKSRLGESGYLRGVVIDLGYDYLLMKNWHLYAKPSLDSFIERFYKNAAAAVQAYPEDVKNFILRLIASGNLTSYGTFEGLRTALSRIDSRLSARVLARESATQYIPVLQKQIPLIEQDFLAFFPELIRFFKSRSAQCGQGHWLR